MNILFIHNGFRSFIQADLEILQSQHQVRVIKFAPGKKYLSEIAANIQWCDLVFGWWASWHMLFPVICAQRNRKPIIVVGGDYDVIYEKQFRSRNRLFMDKLRKLLGYYLFPKIDQYITFSEYSKIQALKLPYIIPERLSRIYCGLPDIATNKYQKKDNLILSVGTIHQYDIYRKGYATFVKSATYLPEYQFELIGPWKDGGIDLLRNWNNKNILYPGYLSNKDLYQAMSDAKVYVQVSLHEGFGMALAEAMLFQCVPVVTDRGAIPEVVGDCGLYVPYGDVQKTAIAIEQASKHGRELGAKARARILSQFPAENRRNQLLDIVEKTYSGLR